MLKKLRVKMFWTQTDLGNALGVTFVTINRWENGKNLPSLRQQKKIINLCNKHGVPLYGNEER